MSKSPDHTQIHARVGAGAIDKVTRMFNAGLSDICVEMLQNARRAGAAAVHVTTELLASGKTQVTITDDGRGLRDASVLLTFGESDWDATVDRAEDPAGMGFLSLARHGCVVRWRRASADGTLGAGCRLTLSPEHFLGRQPASIEPDDDAPRPHGTAVSFELDTPQEQARATVQTAARHYPRPVTVDENSIEQSRFLAQALHTERWKGILFGVYSHAFGSYEPVDLNFHGLLLRARLPDVRTLDGRTWSVRADIESCPDLELVLPARKEAVETPFLNAMRDAARLAIYRALAQANPAPRIGWRDWKRASDAGIALPLPPAELRPWRPEMADVDHYHEPLRYTALSTAAAELDHAACWVVSAEFDPPDAQAFYRAAQRAGMADRLFEADRCLEGFAWYDELPQLTKVTTRLIVDGVTQALADAAELSVANDPVRPETIQMDLHVSSSITHQEVAPRSQTVTIAADVALLGEPGAWLHDVVPLVAVTAEIPPQELAALLLDAFFSPSDDAEADSYTTQRERYEAEALHEATQILVDSDEACKGLIADTVRRELHWMCPEDRDVNIHVRGRTVHVTLWPLPSPSHS